MADDLKCVEVNMFGGFFISWGGKPLELGYGSTTKMIQLLIMVINAGVGGISRKELIDRLYAGDVLEDSAVTLRVNAHRLRKFLKTLPCFKDADCIRVKTGNYYWDRDAVPLLLDTEQFEVACAAADAEKDEEKKIEWLQKACGLYRGEFLPELSGDEWAAVASASWQKKYMKCVRDAQELLAPRERYEELLAISKKACSIYPYEEYYLMQIDCLMALENYKEAMEVYDRATTFYFEELGLTPSAELMERFRQMSDRVQYRASAIEDIRDSLKEEAEKRGAYFCNYPGFCDCYHIVCRMLERNGQSAYLLLCTMVDREGNPLTDEAKLERYMDKLKLAIGSSLRKGDFYTRYGNNQFLVLLMGIKQEDCVIVENRIEGRFLSFGLKARATIEFRINPAGGDEMPGEELTFSGGTVW